MSENIPGSIVRGGTLVFGSSVAKFVTGLGATAILARLLDPEAYGLLAMVFVVTNFLLLFRDMNLSLATVQQKKITHAQVSTIYWINVAFTVAISLAILALAPAIAWFYDEPRLTEIAALLTLSVLFRGFASQHKSLLRRKMRFGAIAAIEIGSMVAGYLVAIVLAWLGHGYWSLVWLHIGSSIADLLLCWLSTRWNPGPPVRGSGVRDMLVFGSNLTGYSVIRFVSRSFDNAVIGWFWGATPLGLYSKSRDTLMPVASYLAAPFGAVAIPSLSRLADEDERYRTTYRQLAEKIAVSAVFGAILLGFAADEVIALILGQKWAAAAPIMAILAVLIFTESMVGCINWLFITQGRGAELFRYSIFAGVSRILAITVGLKWGIVGIAAAVVSISFFVQMPVHIWYGCRSGPISQTDIYLMLAPIALGSVAGILTVTFAHRWMPIEDPVLSILQTATVLAISQLAVLVTTVSGRQTLCDLRRGLRLLIREGVIRGHQKG